MLLPRQVGKWALDSTHSLSVWDTVADVFWPYPLRVVFREAHSRGQSSGWQPGTRVGTDSRQAGTLGTVGVTEGGQLSVGCRCLRGRPQDSSLWHPPPPTLLGHHPGGKLPLGSALPLPARGPGDGWPAQVLLQGGQAQ